MPSASDEVPIEAISKTEIMAYVSRIDDCASEQFRPFIGDLWAKILEDEMLSGLFYMSYGTKKGKPNWYRVTAVVYILREFGVYRKEGSRKSLIEKMKVIESPHNFLNNSYRYNLQQEELMVLRKILKDVQK